MNIDDLREAVWEELFRAKTPESIADLAAKTSCDIAHVRVAVEHEWFNISEQGVSIAYNVTGQNAK